VPETEAEIVELADRIVRSGFATRDEAVHEIVQVIGDGSPSPTLIVTSGQAVDRALVALDHEERLWGLTDNDKLTRAAMALEANGVLFRQNFACCRSCGFSRMPEEVEAAQQTGTHVRGFAFYHWNDLERAVDGLGLKLSFAAIGAYDHHTYATAATAIGHEVVTALTHEGLQPRWAGRHQDRVLIPLRWRRRRFTAPPL
jgi:hypothetical protein